MGLQLNRCTGELHAKEPALFRVQENPLYRIVRWVVLGVWAVFLIGVFVPELIGTCRGKRWSALVVLVLVAIILGTTVPGAVKNEAKYEILSHAKTYAGEIVEYGGSAFGELAAGLQAQKWLSIDITKVAHFLLFALLGGLLYARRGRGAVWPTLIDIGMLACGSELMQLFIDGRSGLAGDVLLDLSGAVCAMLPMRLAARRDRDVGECCHISVSDSHLHSK
jgi:VanZ family protein